MREEGVRDEDEDEKKGNAEKRRRDGQAKWVPRRGGHLHLK